jgi:hypothetical protein
MSEMRRAARSLVERRVERIQSRHPLDASKARVAAALSRAGVAGVVPFSESWTDSGGQVVLEIAFEPSVRTRLFLHATSLVFLLLVATSAWLLFTRSEGALRFLVPLTTALGILGLPFVTLGLASTRDAYEARVLKAIRVALLDEEEKLPPQQRWADED